MLRLVVTASGEKCYELTKEEHRCGAFLKNSHGGLDGIENHADGKTFSSHGSKTCLVQTIKSYLSSESGGRLLIPAAQGWVSNVQSRKRWSLVWEKVLGHNTLENMLKNRTQGAGIQPYFTNHSLGVKTVTILSSINVIKAVTGHKSDASIESYCKRPTSHQFQDMLSALTCFIHGKENTLPSSPTSSSASESTSSVGRSNPGENMLDEKKSTC